MNQPAHEQPAQAEKRPVIVTTKYGGVFFGYARDTSGKRILLEDARMAIYFGTTQGLFELADTGLTKESRPSAPATIELRGITAVLEVTKEAETKWKEWKPETKDSPE